MQNTAFLQHTGLKQPSFFPPGRFLEKYFIEDTLECDAQIRIGNR